MSTATPIPTRYNGFRFRSRLEARWAVFFDNAKIAYQYEPQGFTFHLDGGGRRHYLPDFHLTNLGMWAEVKGTFCSEDAEIVQAAAHQLPDEPQGSSPTRGVLLLRDIPSPVADFSRAAFPLLSAAGKKCRVSATALGGREESIRESVGDVIASRDTLVFPWRSMNLHVLQPAFDAARSARFEHGETPDPRPQSTSVAPLSQLFSANSPVQCGAAGRSAYEDVELYCAREPEHGGKHKGVVDGYACVWGEDGIAW